MEGPPSAVIEIATAASPTSSDERSARPDKAARAADTGHASTSTTGTDAPTAVPAASLVSGLVYRVLPKVAAFVLFMMLHDYLQEQLQFQFESRGLQLPSVFTFLDVCGCCVGPLLSITASGAELWPRHLRREDMMWTFGPLALITVTGITLANASLPLVTYPVKVTVKSFKLIPTMIFASLVLRNKTYSHTTYGAAFFLCLGLAQFLRTDHATSTRRSSPRGVLYIAMSCCADAVAPVLQDKAMNVLKTDPMFVMFFTNTVGVCLVGLAAVLTGEMGQSYRCFVESPGILAVAMLYALSTFCGVFAYMLMVKDVGGVGTALVSTLRKILTVVLSFLANGHRFSWGYASGGAMIVASVLVEKVCRGSNSK
jgi:drug/metabolite transporter (DMT)-like permease